MRIPKTLSPASSAHRWLGASMRMSALSLMFVWSMIPTGAVEAETILFPDRAVWSATTSNITTIDFEGVPPGAANLVGPSYATKGAIFTGASGQLYLADPACCLPYAATDVL